MGAGRRVAPRGERQGRPAAECGCRLPTADCRLPPPTADCPLPTRCSYAAGSWVRPRQAPVNRGALPSTTMPNRRPAALHDPTRCRRAGPRPPLRRPGLSRAGPIPSARRRPAHARGRGASIARPPPPAPLSVAAVRIRCSFDQGKQWGAYRDEWATEGDRIGVGGSPLAGAHRLPGSHGRCRDTWGTCPALDQPGPWRRAGRGTRAGRADPRRRYDGPRSRGGGGAPGCREWRAGRGLPPAAVRDRRHPDGCAAWERGRTAEATRAGCHAGQTHQPGVLGRCRRCGRGHRPLPCQHDWKDLTDAAAIRPPPTTSRSGHEQRRASGGRRVAQPCDRRRRRAGRPHRAVHQPRQRALVLGLTRWKGISPCPLPRRPDVRTVTVRPARRSP